MATLKAHLESPDQSVRLKAALAAGTFPKPEYIDVLVTQCATESDFFVRDTLTWALMRNEVEKVVERLKPELISENPQAKTTGNRAIMADPITNKTMGLKPIAFN